MSVTTVATRDGGLQGAAPAAKQLAANYVAQVAALAIGDAVDYLRNLETVSTAAQSVALELFLAEENPVYVTVITEAQKVVSDAITVLGQVADAAGKAVSAF